MPKGQKGTISVIALNPLVEMVIIYTSLFVQKEQQGRKQTIKKQQQTLTKQCHIKSYEVGTLAVDGWAVTFGTARRGLGGAAARQGPSSLYQM